MKLPPFFQNIQKIVRALRVNETKVPSRNAFIDNLFGLESEKELKRKKKKKKKDERTLFWDSPRSYDPCNNT